MGSQFHYYSDSLYIGDLMMCNIKTLADDFVRGYSLHASARRKFSREILLKVR